MARGKPILDNKQFLFLLALAQWEDKLTECELAVSQDPLGLMCLREELAECEEILGQMLNGDEYQLEIGEK